MKYRIVSDSSSNLLTFPGDIDYKTVPLKILVDGVEYVDEIGLDTAELVAKIKTSQTATSTSCPNTFEWLNAFEGADAIFAITISSQLSGSYSAACAARDDYMASHPEAKVYVIDSLSTGGEMILLIEKLAELMKEERSFEEIKQIIEDYHSRIHLLFGLLSLRNLAKNGRVSPTIAKIAGLLGIHFLGRASDKGTIEEVGIYRGQKKLVKGTVAQMIKEGYQGGEVWISHCLNPEIGVSLKEAIQKEFPNAVVNINQCTGLCSYYAEEGGMILGYETI